MDFFLTIGNERPHRQWTTHFLRGTCHRTKWHCSMKWNIDSRTFCGIQRRINFPNNNRSIRHCSIKYRTVSQTWCAIQCRINNSSRHCSIKWRADSQSRYAIQLSCDLLRLVGPFIIIIHSMLNWPHDCRYHFIPQIVNDCRQGRGQSYKRCPLTNSPADIMLFHLLVLSACKRLSMSYSLFTHQFNRGPDTQPTCYRYRRIPCRGVNCQHLRVQVLVIYTTDECKNLITHFSLIFTFTRSVLIFVLLWILSL